METKFKEEVITTSDFKEMRNKFLAERLLRTWSEDFVDEDTGETIAIERNELILERGTLLNDSELSVINFHIQSGDLTEVKISNQQRSGHLGKAEASVWVASVKYANKKYNLYLYSDSIENAKKIAIDYMEQTAQGLFTFSSIKEVDDSVLIPVGFGLNDEELEQLFEADYYKIAVEIVEDSFEIENTFIVKATDAENAKEMIVKYLDFKKAEENRESEYVVTIISAKTIPCDYVIDYEFSLEYINGSEA